MMGWRHLTDSLLAAQQLECTSMNLTAALVSLGVHALCPSRFAAAQTAGASHDYNHVTMRSRAVPSQS